MPTFLMASDLGWTPGYCAKTIRLCDRFFRFLATERTPDGTHVTAWIFRSQDGQEIAVLNS